MTTIDAFKPSFSIGANEYNDKELVLDKSDFRQDKIMSDDGSMKEEHINQNNVVLNTKSYQDLPGPSSLCETHIKTNSRPQRQAAKKAESQIRVNTFKPKYCIYCNPFLSFVL